MMELNHQKLQVKDMDSINKHGGTDKVVDGQSVTQDFWRSKTGWIPTSLLICRQVQANHPQIPNLSGLRSIALAAHQFQTWTNPNQFTVMNLIFLAWLSSVSICVGGIPAQHLIVPIRGSKSRENPLESPNLVSMAGKVQGIWRWQNITVSSLNLSIFSARSTW